MTRRTGRVGRGDRGAGALEYALAAGLLLVALVAGLQWVQSAGESALDRQSDNLDYTSGGGGVPSTTGGSSSGGSSGGPGPSTPPSSTPPSSTPPPPTAPPSTVAPTTTTTAPPATTTTTTSPANAMTDLRIASATPSVQWWNGKDGAWIDGITFDYRWKNGASITLSVTRNYGNNKSATSTESVQINSGTSSPYLQPNALANSSATNVVSVVVTVISIRTQDANWQYQTFTVNAPSVTIQAPPH